MKYKCLILDHDDTIVNSTESVNYISFSNVLSKIRPDVKITLNDFFKLNFDPGFLPMCYEVFNFNEKEMDYQVNYFKNFISKHNPDVFEGIRDLLWDYVNLGGSIFVISHSMSKDILRHYKYHNLPTPKAVYGFEYEDSKRKPNIWPVEQIIKNYNFDRSEIIMVDDLKPGKIMADNAGISFAAAGWAHHIPEIVDYMKHEVDYYCENVEDLRKLILG